MATTAAEILVRVSADTDALTSGLQRAEAQTKSFGQRMDALGKGMSRVGRNMSVGLTLPIVGFGMKAVGAFEEAQRAARQTEAVLKSTGGTANVTADQIAALSQSLSDQAAVDDELIQQGANMLLTFTNIRNEVGAGNDIFNQSVGLMADFAAGMAAVSGGEMDVRSASIMLGKALNDPIKGVSALGRAGVQFTESQKAQIETLVKSGKTMDAQKMILAELTKQFSGSAAAQATDSNRMKVAFDNLAESVGAILAPAMERLARFMQALTEGFAQLSPGMQKTVVIVGALVAVAGPLLIILGSMAGAFASIAAAAAAAGVTTGVFLGWIILAVAAVAALAYGAYQLIKNWDSVVAFFQGLPSIISGVFTRVRDSIVNAFKAAINAVIGLWNRLDTDFSIKIFGQTISTPDIFPDIPMLAKGGIVTGPTLAMVGERGPEAVIPLSGGGGKTALSVNVVIDRKTFVRQQEYLGRASGL